MKDARLPRAQGWIDVHAHFSTPKTDAELEAGLAVMRQGCFLATEPFRWTPEGAIDHMDRNGIAMQLLSNLPKSLPALRDANDYGAALVEERPSRFGLLAAVPTRDAGEALDEISRTRASLQPDGFAMTCRYGDVYLGDPLLEPVWTELDRLGATVFMHPDAYAGPSLGRPSPLLEVAFETARTIVDMLYAGVFRRYRNIRFVVAHCGGALPALAGRLALLGAEAWVPNPERIARQEIAEQLGLLYLDTAATGTAHTISPAVTMCGHDHLVYGSDCGVPCSSEATLARNIDALFDESGLDRRQVDEIGRNALRLFPSVEPRLATAAGLVLIGQSHGSANRKTHDHEA